MEDVLNQILKYISVYIGSMIKFVAGPATGMATGLSVFETFLFTVLGMMSSVLLFSNIGEVVKRKIIPLFVRKRKVFSARNRRLVKIWKLYGLKGVAFLTPLLLSPIIGTMVAIAFGETKKRVFAFMLVSAIFWGLAFTLILFSLQRIY